MAMDGPSFSTPQTSKIHFLYAGETEYLCVEKVRYLVRETRSNLLFAHPRPAF